MTVVARQPRLPGDGEPGELSTFQAITLAVLADDGGQRLGSLALALGTTDATASRTVDVLEALGLVARRPDGLDRRCIVVAATDEGSSSYANGASGSRSSSTASSQGSAPRTARA